MGALAFRSKTCTPTVFARTSGATQRESYRHDNVFPYHRDTNDSRLTLVEEFYGHEAALGCLGPVAAPGTRKIDERGHVATS